MALLDEQTGHFMLFLQHPGDLVLLFREQQKNEIPVPVHCPHCHRRNQEVETDVKAVEEVKNTGGC